MSILRDLILSACVAVTPIAGLAAADTAGDPPAAAAVAPAKLGSIQLGNIPITVNRLGDVVAGKSLQLEFIVPKETPGSVVLTTWASNLTDPTAAGEMVGKVHAIAGDAGRLTATIQVPATLNKASSLWISIEPADGKAVSGSLPLVPQ